MRTIFVPPLLQHRNTGSCVVDTGVSLSTHVSSYKCNLLGQFISCQARKWEGGHPGRGNDVTGRHESQDYSRGENTAFEQVDISLEWYMWINAQAVTTTALIAVWNVPFVVDILHARLIIFGLCMVSTGITKGMNGTQAIILHIYCSAWHSTSTRQFEGSLCLISSTPE